MTKKPTKETTAKAKAKAKDKPKVEPIKLERVNKRVKHEFTDDELISFGFALGQKYRSIRAVQSEAKAVKADYTAREKSLEADIDEVSGKINARFEMRNKECFKFYDYKGGEVYWFLCADVEDGVDIESCPTADALLVLLLVDEVFSPVNQRKISDNERQQKLDEGINKAADGGGDQPGDEGEPDADKDGKQAVETS